MSDDLITIVNAKDTFQAGINPTNGQLCSLVSNSRELMWGGGKPEQLKAPHEKKEAGGWQNSAIFMFPLVSQAFNDKITIDGQELSMPQHGIVRYMRPVMCKQGPTHLTLAYGYNGNYVVQTPKGEVRFPRSFRLIAEYQVRHNSLDMHFEVENLSVKPLPYAIGWHPAFLDLDGKIETNRRTLTVEEITKASPSVTHRSIILPGETDAKYISADGRIILDMKTQGFGNMQVWRQPSSQPVLCIEPISALPQTTHVGEFAARQGYVSLLSGQTKSYQVKITPRVAV